MKQAELYARLRQHGSSWLKKFIVYADGQLVVLNKPPGLICQLNHNDRHNSRPNGSAMDITPFLRDIQHWMSSQPHLVHRLDKGTTGCLLVAANLTAARAMSQQLQRRTVTKTYLALVQGGRAAFPSQFGQIRNHILYQDGRGEISKEGKLAITDWKLLSSSTRVPISLVQMTLLTGNKHQLRLHLAHCLRAPILGDWFYSKSNPIPSSLYGWSKVPEDRIFLHASEVSLYKYLQTGSRFRLSIRAPLPADFRLICQDIGITVPSDLQTGGLHVSDTRFLDHPELKALRLWDRTHYY